MTKCAVKTPQMKEEMALIETTDPLVQGDLTNRGSLRHRHHSLKEALLTIGLGFSARKAYALPLSCASSSTLSVRMTWERVKSPIKEVS